MGKLDEGLELDSLINFCKNGGIVFDDSEEWSSELLKADPLIFFSSLERCLSNYYRKFFSKQQINHKQFLFLLTLLNEKDNFISMGHFGNRIFLDRTTVLRNTSILKKKGFVYFSVSGKAKKIRLTNKGEELLYGLMGVYKRIVEDVTVKFFMEGMNMIRGMSEK